MMSSGMTQDMGDLDVVSEGEGEGLTDQEAEEGARAYDDAQAHPKPQHTQDQNHRTAPHRFVFPNAQLRFLRACRVLRLR